MPWSRRRIGAEGGSPGPRREEAGQGRQAYLTVVTLHMVVPVHGHHTDGRLTALWGHTGSHTTGTQDSG